MPERLFHLVLPEDWEARGHEPHWAPASLANEGFVHLSCAAQLRGTLAAHYSACTCVWLLELDVTSVADALKSEVSRDGALFPHLYRAIRREEFLGRWEVQRGYGELWTLPTLGKAGDGDLPPRRPLD